MDNFNKILTGFLILLVVVGVALYVFFRFGLLQKYVPAPKNTQGGAQTSPQAVRSPTITTTPTSKPTQRNSLFGWLFPQKIDPTPTSPPVLRPDTSLSYAGTIQTTIITSGLKEAVVQSAEARTNTNTQVETITIPYGSNTPTEYPATGASTLIFPATALVSTIGFLLKRKRG